MLGISIFMNEPLDDRQKNYIREMQAMGAVGVFTSMHIPEDDASNYQQRLIELGSLCQELELKLMVDISGDALNRAGFSFNDLQTLTTIGVTGLRMDYHISNDIIAKASHEMVISLNASTLTEEDYEALVKANANFSNLEAWHNYYPRPETGLSRELFLEKNQWLQAHQFKVVAFAPGDAYLRGPLHLGLPTLEEHRGLHPLAAMLDLMACGVKAVYIGDAGLLVETRQQVSQYLLEKTIALRVAGVGSRYLDYCLGAHVNREDDARDVVRSAYARFREIPEIEVEAPLARDKGAIMLDNRLYGRYMGEIQLAKRDLTQDDKVNVVGRVIKQDIDLIAQIKPGMKYRLLKEEK
jgi:hypothetical protein